MSARWAPTEGRPYALCVPHAAAGSVVVPAGVANTCVKAPEHWPAGTAEPLRDGTSTCPQKPSRLVVKEGDPVVLQPIAGDLSKRLLAILIPFVHDFKAVGGFLEPLKGASHPDPGKQVFAQLGI